MERWTDVSVQTAGRSLQLSGRDELHPQLSCVWLVTVGGGSPMKGLDYSIIYRSTQTASVGVYCPDSKTIHSHSHDSRVVQERTSRQADVEQQFVFWIVYFKKKIRF
jgi:hypothetical protein